MTFGLSIKNSSGVEIVSAGYRGFGIVSSGTRANDAAIPAVSAGQLMLVRPTGTDASGASIKADYRYVSGEVMPTFTSSTGSWEYTIVSSVPSASSESYGLVVKNPDGQITFDSGRKYLMPQGTVAVNYGGYGSGWSRTVFTVPSVSLPTRKRWVLFGIKLFGFLDNGTGEYTDEAVPVVSFVSSTSVALESGIAQTYGPPPESYGYGGDLIFNQKMQVHLMEI